MNCKVDEKTWKLKLKKGKMKRKKIRKKSQKITSVIMENVYQEQVIFKVLKQITQPSYLN